MTGARSRPRPWSPGVGNIFLGDDGFGVETVRRLAGQPAAGPRRGRRHRGARRASGLPAARRVRHRSSWWTPPRAAGRPARSTSSSRAPSRTRRAGQAADRRAPDVPRHRAGAARHPDAPAPGARPPRRVLVVGCEPACLEEGIGLSARGRRRGPTRPSGSCSACSAICVSRNRSQQREEPRSCPKHLHRCRRRRHRGRLVAVTLLRHQALPADPRHVRTRRRDGGVATERRTRPSGGGVACRAVRRVSDCNGTARAAYRATARRKETDARDVHRAGGRGPGRGRGAGRGGRGRASVGPAAGRRTRRSGPRRPAPSASHWPATAPCWRARNSITESVPGRARCVPCAARVGGRDAAATCAARCAAARPSELLSGRELQIVSVRWDGRPGTPVREPLTRSAEAMCRVVDLQAGRTRQERRRARGPCARSWRPAGTAVVNLLSSPGSGKTALLERRVGARPAARRAGRRAHRRPGHRERRAAAGPFRRSGQAGAHRRPVPSGGGHARSAIWTAGCPRAPGCCSWRTSATWSARPPTTSGRRLRVVLASVTEGEDKPLKYPTAFGLAHLVVVTKTGHRGRRSEFDEEEFLANVQPGQPRRRGGAAPPPGAARGSAALLDRALAVRDGAAAHQPVMASQLTNGQGHHHHHGDDAVTPAAPNDGVRQGTS